MRKTPAGTTTIREPSFGGSRVSWGIGGPRKYSACKHTGRRFPVKGDALRTLDSARGIITIPPTTHELVVRGGSAQRRPPPSVVGEERKECWTCKNQCATSARGSRTASWHATFVRCRRSISSAI